VKAEALATLLGVDVSEIEEGYDDCTFEHARGEYLVLTDEEADQRWDEYLDSYLDECVMPELHGTLANYFDRDAWKRDARHDGRGHSLSPYDGNEHEVRLADGTYVYIYRTN
jgi:hypothetical protein